MNVKIKPKKIFVKPKIDYCPISTKKHSYTIDVNDCIICLENNVATNNLMHINTLKCKDIKLTCNCNYYIHLQCLLQWVDIKPICPTCRAPIDVKNKRLSNRNRIRNNTRYNTRRNRRIANHRYNTRQYNDFLTTNRNINNDFNKLQIALILFVFFITIIVIVSIFL